MTLSTNTYKSKPRLTVIAPSGDRTSLPFFLASVGKQLLEADHFEVLLPVEVGFFVEDIVTSANLPHAVHIIEYQNSTSKHKAGFARNRAAASAVGEFLVFIDADCVLAPDCLSEYIRLIEEFPEAALCGTAPEVPYPYHSKAETLTDFEELLRVSVGDYREKHLAAEPTEVTAHWEHFYSCNALVSAAAFREVGGYDEQGHRCHDLDLGYRLHRQGVHLLYSRRTRVVHLEHPRNLDFRREQASGLMLLSEKFPELRSLCDERITWLKQSYTATLHRCEAAFKTLTRQLPGRRCGRTWLLPPGTDAEAVLELSSVATKHIQSDDCQRWRLRLDRNCWDYSILLPNANTGQKPRISVLMTAYNNSRSLRRAVESVLVQTMQSFEIVLVDDASTDETSATCFDLATDARCRLVQRMENGGLSAALNDGLLIAKADVVVQLDADDWLEPDALSEICKAFAADPHLGAVYGSPIVHYHNGEVESTQGEQPGSPNEFLEYREMQAPRAYRTRGLVQIRGWDTSDAYRGRFYEDRWTLARMADRFKIGRLEKPVYHVELKRNSLSRRSPLTTASAKLSILYGRAQHDSAALEYDYDGNILRARIRPEVQSSQKHPWTVIIPYAAHPELLRLSLLSWYETALAETGGEIIVVDDCASTPAAEILSNIPDHVTIIRNPTQTGPAATRNRGANIARNDFLFFSDADHIVPPSVLDRHSLRHAASTTPTLVCGGIFGRRAFTVLPNDLESKRKEQLLEMVRFEKDFLRYAQLMADEKQICILDETKGAIWKQAARYSSTDPWLSSWGAILISFGEDLSDYPFRWTRVATGSLSILREAFFRLGGFDERFLSMEDWELGIRAQQHGYKIVCAPDAEPFHQIHPRDVERPRRNYQAVRLLQTKHPSFVQRLIRPAAPVPSSAQAIIRQELNCSSMPRSNSDGNRKLQKLQSYSCLTFDDGPHSVSTPMLLETLDQINAKATFFFLGSNVRDRRSLCRMVYENGHEIGIHAWTHMRFDRLSMPEIRGQLRRSKALMEDITGHHVRFVRPPYGMLTPVTLDVCQELDLQVAGWDVSGEDWRETHHTGIIKALASKALKGQIILLHDPSLNPSATQRAVHWLGIVLGNAGVKLITLRDYSSCSPVSPLPVYRPPLW